jgi:uroporphyrinogen-III synthase
MPARALIGRAADWALQAELARRNIEPLFVKLLEIEPLPLPADFTQRLEQAQAVLLSSANAVPALSAARRDLPVLAVGDATAQAARAAGFAQVESADGDAMALAALARRRSDPAAGPLLYLRGADVAGDLVGQLAGFSVDQAVVYRAVPVRELPAAARGALAQGELEFVALFSPRAAAGFVSLVTAAGLAQSCSRLKLLALSSAVAQAADLPWASRHIATHPSRPGMLAAIDQMQKDCA